MPTIGDKDEREYMTSVELMLFKSQRNSGELSFFRTSTCEQCGIEIHKARRFCSKPCMKNNRSEESEDGES